MYYNYSNPDYNNPNLMYNPYNYQNTVFPPYYNQEYVYQNDNSRQNASYSPNHFLAQNLAMDDFSVRSQLMKHDIEYLNTLYPYEINELKQLVTSECDKMDYSGSMIYDECPDKVMFLKKCNDICALADCNCEYAKKCEDKGFLKDLISILLADEIYRRRDNKRRFY